MEDVLIAIESALEKKGLSAAAASKLAVGNSALIKNFKNRRAKERDHPIENLKKLADVLDLEFYFGPPRGDGDLSTPTGFAEAARKFSIDGAVEALRQGFLPIPFHWEDRAHRGTAPVALARAWLYDLGLAVDHLSFVSVPDGSDLPCTPDGALALIDGADHTPLDGRLFAFCVQHEVRIARLHRLSSGAMMALSGAHHAPTVEELAPTTTRILGAVVWTGGLT